VFVLPPSESHWAHALFSSPASLSHCVQTWPYPNTEKHRRTDKQTDVKNKKNAYRTLARLYSTVYSSHSLIQTRWCTIPLLKSSLVSLSKMHTRSREIQDRNRVNAVHVTFPVFKDEFHTANKRNSIGSMYRKLAEIWRWRYASGRNSSPPHIGGEVIKRHRWQQMRVTSWKKTSGFRTVDY